MTLVYVLLVFIEVDTVHAMYEPYFNRKLRAVNITALVVSFYTQIKFCNGMV